MSLLYSNEDFQQLLETKQLYKEIFNCSVQPSIVHDMYLNIIDVNSRAAEEFGYTKEELLELQIFDLHTTSELPHSVDVLEKMRETDNLTVKTEFQRKDGSVFTAEAVPCKISMKRFEVIHVHLQNIEEVVESEQY